MIIKAKIDACDAATLLFYYYEQGLSEKCIGDIIGDIVAVTVKELTNVGAHGIGNYTYANKIIAEYVKGEKYWRRLLAIDRRQDCA